jgi:hypothetical protein
MEEHLELAEPEEEECASAMEGSCQIRKSSSSQPKQQQSLISFHRSYMQLLLDTKHVLLRVSIRMNFIVRIILIALSSDCNIDSRIGYNWGSGTPQTTSCWNKSAAPG